VVVEMIKNEGGMIESGGTSLMVSECYKMVMIVEIMMLVFKMVMVMILCGLWCFDFDDWNVLAIGGR
jgi:hypothetical protein